MSCDWRIKCVDCDDTHDFTDANHQVKFMRILIKHRDAIANLDALMSEPDNYVDIYLKTWYGNVDISFFKEHAGHKLIPISEYGDIDDGKIT